jgi:[glutamine synthetase] adenylyltransferase / [glutamine synthetase]-adenylyl-L-tyrosine phosphorylase
MTQTDTIDHAFHYSRYAARLRRADAPWVDKILNERAVPIDWTVWQKLALSATSDNIDSVLRTLRKTLMLRTLLCDIVDGASFTGLVHSLTQFADLSVNAAVAAHSRSLFGTDAPPRDFSVVAMGKMGGFELNVSSDIDIVFLCEDPDATHTDELSKLARAVSRTLDRSIDGDFVFRVDTRLRPYGDAGPVVPTLDFLERYFVEQGRMWERIAWLRSRLCAGSLQSELSALVQPFVFRRYLDFDAVAGMRELHAQLRNEKNNPRNIKLAFANSNSACSCANWCAADVIRGCAHEPRSNPWPRSVRRASSRPNEPQRCHPITNFYAAWNTCCNTAMICKRKPCPMAQTQSEN